MVVGGRQIPELRAQGAHAFRLVSFPRSREVRIRRALPPPCSSSASSCLPPDRGVGSPPLVFFFCFPFLPIVRAPWGGLSSREICVLFARAWMDWFRCRARCSIRRCGGRGSSVLRAGGDGSGGAARACPPAASKSRRRRRRSRGERLQYGRSRPCGGWAAAARPGAAG